MLEKATEASGEAFEGREGGGAEPEAVQEGERELESGATVEAGGTLNDEAGKQETSVEPVRQDDTESMDGQLEKISFDSGNSDLENVEILSRHYNIPNILIKSLFDLNNKRKTQLMGSFGANGGSPKGSGAPGDVCKFILELEAEVIEFIVKPSVDSWKMKPLNSYYRLLSHQLADYYHLGHILSNDGSSMVLFKINTSLINADDETKKNAKFDQSGNIRPLDFRNLKFDPQEKLNRIKLADLYKTYQDVFDKNRYDTTSNDEAQHTMMTQNFNNLRIDFGESDRNMNNNVRIMRRTSKKSYPGEGGSTGPHFAKEYEPGTQSSVSEESFLSKEERYKLVKERIEKEQAENEKYDGLTPEAETEGDYDDDDAEIIISDGYSEHSTMESNSTGGYRSDRGGYSHSASNHSYTNNDKYRKNYDFNGYRRNSKNYKGNRHPNYNYRNQYAYYPNGQMYAGLPPQPPPPPNSHPPYGYMIAPNSSPNMPMGMDMNLATSPIGSPNSSSTMMASPPYYYIPVMPPVSNGSGVNMAYKKKSGSNKNRNSTEEVPGVKEGTSSENSLSPVSTNTNANGEGYSDSLNSPSSQQTPMAQPPAPVGSNRVGYSVPAPNMPMMMPMGTAQMSRPMYQYYYPMRGNQYYPPPNASGVPPSGMYMPVMYYGDSMNKDGNYATSRNKKYYGSNGTNGYHSSYNNYSKKSFKNYTHKNGSGSNGYDNTNASTDTSSDVNVDVDVDANNNGSSNGNYNNAAETGVGYTDSHNESTVESVES